MHASAHFLVVESYHSPLTFLNLDSKPEKKQGMEMAS